MLCYNKLYLHEYHAAEISNKDGDRHSTLKGTGSSTSNIMV